MTTMVDEALDLNLGDIPDLSGVQDNDQPAPFSDGWYEGRILAKREFTDSNGNERVFESSDEPAQKSGRNIRLQIAIKRQSDGRTLNTSYLVNYQPEDLTSTTVQAIMAHKDRIKEGAESGWGTLFRPFMTLQRLGKLQKVAGVRQFQRNGNGGLDLKPVFGKTVYVKLTDDDRNPKYKAVKDISADQPKVVL